MMTHICTWTNVEKKLDELLELPKSEQSTALRRIAAGHPVLYRELETLLARVDYCDTDTVLDRHAVGIEPQGPPPAPALNVRIGAYRTVALLGSGGMGDVFLAERADGQFQQQVALKLLRAEAAEHAERFQVERQILARLEHPGIARLIDGGVSADSRPYMVMELVRGKPITQWCSERRAGLQQRLRLFVDVCATVADVHQKLIVHRDLKPSNVLVSEAGSVKVVDFGIAKLIGSASDEQTRAAPLTPGRAAPEQMTGDVITTATDVYALGLLLFELLCGELPWQQHASPLVAMLDQALHADLPPPSQFAEQRSGNPVPARSLRGDLDAIVLKALQRSPVRRYATASDLMADIHAYLVGNPVRARSQEGGYVLRRFLQRHNIVTAAARVALTVVVAASTVIFMEAFGATAQRDHSIPSRNRPVAEWVNPLITHPNTAEKPATLSSPPSPCGSHSERRKSRTDCWSATDSSSKRRITALASDGP